MLITVGPMRSTTPCMEEDYLRSGLSGKTKLLNVLDGQGITMRLQRYTFAEILLPGEEKATFNQAALDI